MERADRFRVVINHEEQYSIVPFDVQTPSGWKDVGKQGTRQQTLDYIEEI